MNFEEKTMIWTNKTPVYLYGAAGFGTLVYNKLNDYCNLVAFIDERFDEIKSYLDLPVIHVTQPTQSEKRESIVIVCVKNIFEHETITSMLIENEYEHIIFHPVNESIFAFRSVEERQVLIDSFVDITKGRLQQPCEIPSAKGLFKRHFADSAILKRNEDELKLTALIPSTFVFTRPRNDGYLSDLPILSLFSHLEMFDYLSGDVNADYKFYMDIVVKVANEAGDFEKTSRWQDNILKARQMVYERIYKPAQWEDVYLSR